MSQVQWPRMKRDLVAILRGVRPNEVEGIANVLVEVGFQAIEIPLNSPDPLNSIEKISNLFDETIITGAGTVTNVADCQRVIDAGGKLIVSPNVNRGVIALANTHGLVSMPGVLTPTEAYAAINAGASALKFFPANILDLAGIKAILTILPNDTRVGVVGGVSTKSLKDFAGIGIRTFGLGSNIYSQGDTAETVKERARLYVEEYDHLFNAGA
ncbi:2-dehydro-3-deoxy-6-phosphogalactonate aldolase [Brucella gallinifaecis]|uniref:2-dehydro-3-deoxy-6-phosphogalactonate aldolase n=1 Tax=Brucella gallinifaecis TaxID=215590 RepID=A0A502BL48_9HYPH|nr:2-dehydro-3-deoxy-6-phosphogalactonate aldolase [Brucella gallinifaecis]TPF74148.1 2-dehydro-3-deoxy-6-phosphogalactonate aldolase [Brucella gallinifaecis]